MRLRARTPQGNINVGSELTPDSTISDLYKNLESQLKYSNISIKFGFPPKKIEADMGDRLASIGIKDGDVIVVDQVAKAADPVPTQAGQIDNLGFGVLIPRIMKDDNSCLFRAIAYIFFKDTENHGECRKIVVSSIVENPLEYNEAILGKIPQDYCNWISKPNSWGGAIELAIFSDYFKTVIVSVDVATGRADRFGEDKYSSYAFVIYSGIHYDALAVSPEKNAPNNWDLVVFEGIEADQVQIAAQGLAEQWKNEHKYTDLGSFTLKCGNCQKGIRGQQEAQSHALSTGHTNFTEYA